ncbi:MAG: hypothetical protein DRI34_13325 [Deltaproteobacteria bacterium]|nr:MAG: hypothetical protein DRI34_13325 [Deltaproteobacteria bacterium]
MFWRQAYLRGEKFGERAAGFERPLFVLAHHDDEIPTAGLLQLLAERARVVWTTNSDGLYFESDLDPASYGELRKQEGLRSVALAGVEAGRTACLGFSEVEIYRRLSRLHSGAESVAAARPFFQQLRDAIREQVLEFRPDAVFTLAWQGGHPEHDLVHFFTSLAIADLVASGHPRPEFFHLPAYEYTILVAMRFHPLYRGERIRLRLGPRQLDCKLRMIAAYPSQVRLFNDFRKVFRYLVTPLGTISGGARSVEQFLAVEEFGPVPSIDYRRPPHLFDYFTYMFDDFEGVPVTFSRSLRPLVSDFLEQPG